MMEQFFFDMIAPALSLDSLTTSHPISVEVKDPKEIEAIFDHISYKKVPTNCKCISFLHLLFVIIHQGAAIIHMLEDTVGEDTLRQGLSKYLKKHKFGNAVTNDLWSAISDEWMKQKDRRFNITVQEMMDTWTLQMGYPIINFIQQNDTNIYSIEQQRFYSAMTVSEQVSRSLLQWYQTCCNSSLTTPISLLDWRRKQIRTNGSCLSATRPTS